MVITDRPKLYIEYRVYFDPSINQEMLDEVASAAQDEIYTLFEHASIDEIGMPSPHDVTYEIIMELPPSSEVKK